MSIRPLPARWVFCTLPEISIINPKSTLSDSLDVGFVPMALVPTGFHRDVEYEIRKWSEVKNGYTHFQDGDVIFAKITPCFENSKAAIISSLPNKSGCGSTEYFVIRPMICPPQFLYYFFKSQEFLKSGEAVMTGSVGQKRVPSEYVKNRPIPLPPLAEQRRIVAKLDSILPRVERVRERLEKIPALVKRFRQSVLTAAVTGKLTEGWREKNPGAGEWLESTIGECGEVTGGVTKNAKRDQLPLKKPYLRVANVYSNRLELGEVTEIRITDGEYRKTRLFPGDLLIVEGNGSLDQIGRVAIWGGQISDCVHQNHLIRWRTSGPDPRYVLMWLLSPAGRELITEQASTSAGLHTLSISKVSSIAIPLPPVTEQKEIVRQVDKLFALADKLEAHYHRAMARVEKFPQAILAKAFRGELVPQDPNDEPAEKLLERIRQERAGMESVGSAKKKPSAKPKRAKAKAMA